MGIPLDTILEFNDAAFFPGSSFTPYVRWAPLYGSKHVVSSYLFIYLEYLKGPKRALHNGWAKERWKQFGEGKQKKEIGIKWNKKHWIHSWGD